MNISILLSTIRPGAAAAVIDNINSVDTKLSYEILVYSTAYFSKENTRCFTGNLSSVFAYNYLYKKSIGEVIVGAVDDHFFNNNWPNIYHEIQQQKQHQFQMLHILSTGKNQLPDAFRYGYNPSGCDPRFSTLCFPAFLRSTVEDHLCGCYFNPTFLHHHVDIWLGHFTSLCGREVLESKSVKLIPNNNTESNIKWDNYDEAICYHLVQKINIDRSLPYDYFLGVDEISSDIEHYDEIVMLHDRARIMAGK